MAKITGYQNGYDAAVAAMRAALYGDEQSGAGGCGTQSQPLPQLPMDKKNKNKGGDEQSRKGDGEMNNDLSSKKLDGSTLNEIDDSQVGANGGGFLSQDAGSKIAEQAGYKGRTLDKKSESSIAKEWQDATLRASHKAGKEMGDWIRKIDKLYKTKHDWKGELRLYIGNSLSKVMKDSKWGERKSLAVFGELKKYDRQSERDLDKIIYCIDVSGSVSSKLLNCIIGECVEIAKRKGIKKSVYIPFDHQVQTSSIQEITGNKLPDPKMKGGGGTSFENLFEYLENEYGKKHKKIPLVMVFTDGMCNPIPKRQNWMKNLIWVAYDNKSFGDKIKGLDNKSVSDKNTKFIYLSTSDVKAY